jgi:hypothetical protein
MVINGLNSGAKVYMADFEDSASPTVGPSYSLYYYIRISVPCFSARHRPVDSPHTTHPEGLDCVRGPVGEPG